MEYSKLLKRRYLAFVPLFVVLILMLACGDDATPVPQVIETVKEVPVEVVKEVPVEVIKEVPVEVIKEVPVTVVAEVIKEVEVPVMAKETTRLRFVTEAPWIETLLAWTSGSWGVNLVARNHVDHMVHINNRTGKLEAGLATKWEMTSPDAKQWKYELRKGVSFSHGYGEFTSKDVRQLVDFNTEEGAYDAGKFGAYFGATNQAKNQSVRIIDDYTVEFNIRINDPDFDFLTSLARWGIHSKAQFEAIGVEGMQKEPAGTGPWKFKSHTPGFGLNWEGKKDHYRKSPDFDELNLILVPEAATRYAMLRAGEVTMVEIPRELHADAVSNGFGILSSLNPALQSAIMFGGNYRKDTPEYDPTAPLTNVKVREALNRAIDRDLLHKEIFKGVGWPQKLWIYHDGLDPWNPEWDAKFDEMYGYNPERARELIKEAGYPNGFDFDLMSYTLTGFPEMAQITEYLFNAYRDIGLNPKVTELEFARIFPKARNRELHNMVFVNKTSWEPVFWTVTIYNTSPAVECCHIFHSYENERIDDLYNQLLQSPDKAERSRLLLEIGNIKYNNYDAAPLFWLPGQVVVDRSQIKGWEWSGRVDSVHSQFEYVEAAG